MSVFRTTNTVTQQKALEREAMLLALAALNGQCPEDIRAARVMLRKALGLAPHVRVEVSHPVPEAPMVEVPGC